MKASVWGVRDGGGGHVEKRTMEGNQKAKAACSSSREEISGRDSIPEAGVRLEKGTGGKRINFKH